MISAVYETGNVSTTDTDPGVCVGGFVGSNNVGPNTHSIANALWDTDTNSQQSGYSTNDDCSPNGGEGISAITSANLKGQLQTGFDSAIWALDSQNGFPYLIANPPP